MGIKRQIRELKLHLETLSFDGDAMSQETWDAIKNSKSFNVRIYRALKKGLVISVFLNLLLSLGIYYVYFHEPARDFYATSGITPPVPLKPLDAPNSTGTHMLEPDPVVEEITKTIPD